MDFPVVHGPFVQPVIEELFFTLALKRKRNQVSLDRQTLPIADFLAYLDVELYDFSQIRVIIVPDVAPIVIICLLYTSPSPRDPKTSRMPSSA